MNKKGQIMSIMFALIVFFILWAMFFASWISDWGQSFILQHSLSGLEAFLVSGMNIWILAGVIIGTTTTIYLGGSS